MVELVAVTLPSPDTVHDPRRMNVTEPGATPVRSAERVTTIFCSKSIEFSIGPSILPVRVSKSCVCMVKPLLMTLESYSVEAMTITCPVPAGTVNVVDVRA